MSNADLIRKVYALHASGDVDGATAQCADDMQIDWMGGPENEPYSGSHRGREMFARHLRMLHETFEYTDFRVVDMVAAGDRVATRLKLGMRHRSSGTEFVIDAADFWTVRDGKIVEYIEYYDTALAARVLAT